MRVVAGEAGGLRLVAPRNARPTTDRTREAVFSALGDRVVGTTVLDLYAGSGAMAIEALSRGASSAVLIDRDRDSELACQRNLETTGFADRARFFRSSIAEHMWGDEPWPGGPYGLVFCDPPYSMPDVEIAKVLRGLHGCLTDSALVVVERPAPKWDLPEGWSTHWQRKYGDTLISIVHLAS